MKDENSIDGAVVVLRFYLTGVDHAERKMKEKDWTGLIAQIIILPILLPVSFYLRSARNLFFR